MSKSRNSKYFMDFEDNYHDQNDKKQKLDEVRKAKRAKKKEHDEAFEPVIANTGLYENDDGA